MSYRELDAVRALRHVANQSYFRLTLFLSFVMVGIAGGVVTSVFPNYYFYRVSPDPVFINSGILRSNDWHVFRFYIRWPEEGCSYGEIDGFSKYYLGANCVVTPASTFKYGLVSDWGLTDQPTGYHGIWDNAVYYHP